jgi:D-tyrosyl-tRNA(Tyr) deacylase
MLQLAVKMLYFWQQNKDVAMKVILQRVKSAAVSSEGKEISQIGPGLLLLVGIRADDTLVDIENMVGKTLGLRIFDDEEGKLNKTIIEAFKSPELLVVSNFTIYGDTRKGRRPSFIRSAKAKKAETIFNGFVSSLEDTGVQVKTGTFGAVMEVSLVNDGPVTLIIETDHVKEE